jgi:hypothetical protein
MHVTDMKLRITLHLRNLPPDIARSLTISMPTDETVLFNRLKILVNFHRSTLVSAERVAAVTETPADSATDSVDNLASALVNALDLHRGPSNNQRNDRGNRFGQRDFQSNFHRTGSLRGNFRTSGGSNSNSNANQRWVRNPQQGFRSGPAGARDSRQPRYPLNQSRGNFHGSRGGNNRNFPSPQRSVKFAVDQQGNPVCAQCGDSRHWIADCPQNPRTSRQNFGQGPRRDNRFDFRENPSRQAPNPQPQASKNQSRSGRK